MYELVLAAVLVAPLTGIVLMELGAYGPDVGEFGYANGAALGYVAHLVMVYVVYYTVRRVGRRWATPLDGGSAEPPPPIYSRAMLARLAIATLVLQCAIFALVYFVIGARAVVSGQVGKEEFRSTLGRFGVVAFLTRDFVIPLLTTLVAFVYRRVRPGPGPRALLGVTLLMTALNGAVWGFKALTILMLIPALIVLLPRPRPTWLVVLGLVGYAALVFFAMTYDGLPPTEAAFSVLVRGTVGTGNTAWKIWDLQRAGDSFPPYWPTLFSVFGGRLSAVFGIFSRDDASYAYQYDYTALTTLIAKNFAPSVNYEASNVTGTVFSEGLIAFGMPGYLLLSVVAGVVAGFNRLVLDRAQARQRPLLAAVAATFFLVGTFTWLNAGGVVSLIQLPFLVNYAVAFGIGYLLLAMSGVPLRRRTNPAARPRAPAPVEGWS